MIGIATPYYLQIFLLACINIILTLSLNLINGFCGQFSICQAAFMAIGAYSSAIITTILPKCGLYNFKGFPLIFQETIFFIALLLGGFIAGAIAFLIGLPLLRLRGDYFAIGTLAFAEVVRSGIKMSDCIGSNLFIAIGGPRGLSGIPKLTNIFWVISLTIITIFIITRLVNSSYGRAWSSIRDDEIAASMMGINTIRYKLLAFGLSAFFAGIGGGLYSHLLMFIHPDSFSLLKSVEYLVYLYLGGTGSIIGSIVSASSLTFLLEGLRIIGASQWRLVIYPLILIILMLMKPEGLFKKDL